MATPTVEKPTAAKRSRRAGVPKVKDETHNRTAVDELAPASHMLREIPLDTVDPHPLNPRKDLGDLTDLAASIGEQGVLEPVILVPVPGSGKFPARYLTIAGHRRCAAAKTAGLTTVPAIIREGMSDAEQLEVMVVENGHRSDLTVIEQGAAFQGLLDLGVKRTAIAKRTGYSATVVGQRVKVSALPENITTRVVEHQLTFAEALQFADLKTAAPEVYEKAIASSSPTPEMVVRGAINEAARAERIRTAIAEWKERGHELRVGGDHWAPPSEDALRVRHYLGMEVDEHAHCEGAVVTAPEAWLDNLASYGNFWCIRPDLHADRVAEIEAEREATAAARNAPAPVDEERVAADAEWRATADARWLWVSQLLTSTDPAQQRARDVLIDHAVAIVKNAPDDFAEMYLGKPANDGDWPTDPAAALALAVVHTHDSEVPTHERAATHLVEEAHESYMKDTAAAVRAYLTLIGIAGYELTSREQSLLDDLTPAPSDEADDDPEETS